MVRVEIAILLSGLHEELNAVIHKADGIKTRNGFEPVLYRISLAYG